MNGPIIHGGGISAAALKYGGKPEDWLDLSTGINPCPVAIPPIPMAAWHRLPDSWLLEKARLAASHFYRTPGSLPLPVPGTQSVIQLLPRLTQGRRVAILSPTYGEYGKSFASAGMIVDAIADLDQITTNHCAVVIVNPNNPTGRIYSTDDILSLHSQLSDLGRLLIIDEAFADMTPDISVADEAGKRDGLIVMRSFGKFFGLAGLRLGFVVAKEPVLNQIQDWLGPWAVSGPALSMACQLMDGEQKSVRQSIQERSSGLQSVLRHAGLNVIGRTDLFALVHHEQAADLFDHLAKAHILVRKFDYASEWLRVGLTPDPESDTRFSKALSDFKRM